MRWHSLTCRISAASSGIRGSWPDATQDGDQPRDGRFEIKLAPGRYTVRAANPGGLDRVVRKLAMTVAANRVSFVRLDFDSGIH
jgi:hypothetical protein